MTAANAAVWATDREKKLPVIVTNVMPRATVPMIAAARRMFSRFSTPRNPGVAVTPKMNRATVPMRASAGTRRLRPKRLPKDGAPSARFAPVTAFDVGSGGIGQPLRVRDIPGQGHLVDRACLVS